MPVFAYLASEHIIVHQRFVSMRTSVSAFEALLDLRPDSGTGSLEAPFCVLPAYIDHTQFSGITVPLPDSGFSREFVFSVN